MNLFSTTQINTACLVNDGTQGACLTTANCDRMGGRREAGHCPGNKSIQCCVIPKPPTPVPSKATPAPTKGFDLMPTIKGLFGLNDPTSRPISRPVPAPAPTYRPYKFTETRTFKGKTCRGNLAGQITGVTDPNCNSAVPASANVCLTLPNTISSAFFSTKSQCIYTEGDPFSQYGTGLWAGFSSSASTCGDIYGTTNWRFTVVGVCNVLTTPGAGGAMSWMLTNCDNRNWQASYYSTTDCSGTPTSSATTAIAPCQYIGGQYKSQVCIQSSD